jgi:hypothetical protein
MLIPVCSYIEPGPGHYILIPPNKEAGVAKPQLACIVDMQAELDAYKCQGIIEAIQQSLRNPQVRQPVLFILWPDAGPVIPELAFAGGIQSEAVQKVHDGGEELLRFWERQDRPGNIQMMGINLNVCVYNAVGEFLSCCDKDGIEPPIIHFKKSTLADTNYLDDPKFGWDHFRHVISAYCPHQKPPQDTEYVVGSSDHRNCWKNYKFLFDFPPNLPNSNP